VAAEKIFLAGASGVIGTRLSRLLSDAGYEVYGTTRVAAKARMLEEAGATPVIVDVFDADALTSRVREIRPAIVIHQLTDLPRVLDHLLMANAIAGNARIRRIGTHNLVAAGIAAGASRMIAQSIAWAYAPEPAPHTEASALDISAEGARATTIGGVVALESRVMESPPLDGIVLRYGRLYGPGTGVDAAPDAPAVHADAAAHAALLAVQRARTGIFNVAEDSDLVSTEKARRELGWSPAFRIAH
jgi:nucleoside-diphosphate-sugar epimerase